MVKNGQTREGAYRPRLPLSENPETMITCACMHADFLWRKVTKLTRVLLQINLYSNVHESLQTLIVVQYSAKCTTATFSAKACIFTKQPNLLPQAFNFEEILEVPRLF